MLSSFTPGRVTLQNCELISHLVDNNGLLDFILTYIYNSPLCITQVNICMCLDAHGSTPLFVPGGSSEVVGFERIGKK